MPEVSKEDANRFLSSVPEDKKFWCSNGEVFSNLKELEISLKTMNNETFEHHVNEEKNDFSTWIYDIVGHAELAAAVRNMKDRKKVAKEIQKSIKVLKRAAN
jgi:hypothetical protein